jgi:hypothetical protein
MLNGLGVHLIIEEPKNILVDIRQFYELLTCFGPLVVEYFAKIWRTVVDAFFVNLEFLLIGPTRILTIR